MAQQQSTAHAARVWRVDEIAARFELEDVWGAHTPGTVEDFPRFVETVRTSLAPAGRPSPLLQIRFKLGRPDLRLVIAPIWIRRVEKAWAK